MIKNKNFTKILILTLIFNFFSTYTIEKNIEIIKFNPEQHKEDVLKIIKNDAKYLTYEALGYPQGTTEKYLTSSKYKTDVLLIDSKVIGFINYISYDLSLLTFNFGRHGIIHLMAIDKNHRKKGYGKLLFNHAITELNKCYVPIITVSVKKDNKAAIKLYEQAGFENTLENSLASIRTENPELYKKIYESMQDLYYTKKFDVPEYLLPKGNLIQRYPKTSLAILAAGTSAVSYYYKTI